MESKCDTMLVIGNGFDLSLGLKTSYGDFMKWLEDNRELSTNNLYKYLKFKLKENIKQGKRWIDIENELKKYSLSFFDVSNIRMYIGIDVDNKNRCNLLRKEYKEICSKLCFYLSSLVGSPYIDKRGLDKLMEHIPYNQAYSKMQNKSNENPVWVLNFNYTSCIERFRDSLNIQEIHHIHGALPDKENIVFGVEDGCELNQEHSFLYKSHNRVLNVNHLNERFEDAKHILFYGYSLGQTDHSYFEDFFREQSTQGCERKKFDFFYYDETAYDDLFWQLRKLTNNRMVQFKTFNEVNFIKVKE